MYTYLCPSFALSCSLTESINVLGRGVVMQLIIRQIYMKIFPHPANYDIYWVRIDFDSFIIYLSRKVVKIVGHVEWTLL